MYGSTHETKFSDDAQKADSQEVNQSIFSKYHVLSSLTFIKVLKILLSFERIEELSFALENYEKEKSFDDDLNSNGTSDNWNEANEKIEDIISLISYELFASNEPWERLKLSKDIFEIIVLLRNHKNLTLVDRVPHFLFLLRDRMLAVPSSIPELLPQCIKALSTKGNDAESNELNDRMMLSVFGALSGVNTKSREVQHVIMTSITNHLKFFATRLSTISALGDHISQDKLYELISIVQSVTYCIDKKPLEFADSLISSGVFQEFVQIFSTNAQNDNTKSLRHFLLLSATKAPKLAKYLHENPSFIELLKDDTYQKNAKAEIIYWQLLFSVLFQASVEEACTTTEELVNANWEESPTDLRHLNELLQYLQIFKNEKYGKASLADKSHPFTSLLYKLQDKVISTKTPEDDATTEEKDPVLEKLRDRLVSIRQMLKGILQNGKSD